MNIVHISPTYFHDSSVIGGGERYAYELAKALARREEVTFISFANSTPGHARVQMDGDLRVVYFRKFSASSGREQAILSPAFIGWIRRADILHCHQVHTLATDIALFTGRILGKRVFLTDLGGGQHFALSYHLPLLQWAEGMLLLSEYSRALWRRRGGWTPKRLEVIHGGVDPDHFTPAEGSRDERVLFVGRLLPHKGVDYLVEAVSPDMPMDIVGRGYDAGYLAHLRNLACGKAIRFLTNLADQELVDAYRRALVTVLPSVYDGWGGCHTDSPELLGLTLLESMACATPVIGTRVGALPEVIEDGVNGFLVPPNDPNALREKIEFLRENPDVARTMGDEGRRRVLARFTWDQAATACLRSYRALA